MRLIDADALTEMMDEHFRHIGRAEEVRDMINSLPTITHSGWIPCSERLPESAGSYNVTLIDVVSKQIDQETATFGFLAGTKEWIAGRNPVTEKSAYIPIAWQPLPAPWSGAVKEE